MKQLAQEILSIKPDVRILIVEDEADYAELLKQTLLPISHPDRIIVVDTMEAALGKIAEHSVKEDGKFELITLDINLKDTQRNKTLERIHEMKRLNKGGLLLVVSGISNADAKEIVDTYGADAFIHKMNLKAPTTFIGILNKVIESIVSRPSKYQSNISVLEKLAAKFVARQTQHAGEQTVEQPQQNTNPIY